MISDARNGHVSPGIYTEEKDVSTSVKSVGITSLGLVGETLYGPAFQNVEISSWSEYIDYFGGTSVEKYNNGNPKYELPFIAKSYLEESKRLNVVRVLGLSGYEAGPAWVLGAGEEENQKPVLVLRSVMVYDKAQSHCNGEKDIILPIVSSITKGSYVQNFQNNVCDGEKTSEPDDNVPTKFSITVTCNQEICGRYGYNSAYTYNVSLTPGDCDYIYNIISDSPENKKTPIYIEALYESNINDLTTNSVFINVKGEETSTVTITKYYKGERINSAETRYNVTECEPFSNSDGTYSGVISDSIVDLYNSEKYNGNYEKDTVYFINNITRTYKATSGNFKTHYQAAQTPWIISEISTQTTGEGNDKKETNIARRLFRFITISDGNAANYQVKVSIEKINVEKGTFNVVVRDFNDSDTVPMVLERFLNCNLIPGDSNYIAYKIGSIDGGFIAKSKYVLVEMADDGDFGTSFPAGFEGYPIPKYGMSGITETKYNCNYDNTVKPKRQYFGMSNKVGIDKDILSFKGVVSGDTHIKTKGFHMDSNASAITVNGNELQFSVVSSEKVGNEKYAPRFINHINIDNTIYKDINLRKFTVCFYGGFDGWDLNRTERTNTNDYKATRYDIVSEENTGVNLFTKCSESETLMNLLNLPETAITTDYYAYLAGARVFVNPQDIDINLLATPGINWSNHSLLTEEIIDIVEDSEDGRGGDTLYIMESPNVDNSDDLVSEFSDTDINSSYACTYFPWVMYHDASNKRYIEISATKDVVRNMASIDNNKYPWFAPAGMLRGNVNCVKTTFKTTLADEDKLYEVGINPVKSYAQDGVKIWGNKTTYNDESPLNRINVRRLMIRIKKLVTDVARNLIFEQYDEALEKQFRGLVEPILADVKSNRGIIDYKVITESTPETRDQHILPAKILVKPTQALEYISISFVVYPESVSFDEN